MELQVALLVRQLRNFSRGKSFDKYQKPDFGRARAAGDACSYFTDYWLCGLAGESFSCRMKRSG